ncbi:MULTISPECIES: acyl-CoA thioester hydrolase/BAAT C-terminal domain-containing protein [unclassified Duganella]|uniref:acyl-CoA thioester hydrolase/BAAT C-terminal domain-containing protein n=1 Tax=unclassified Duganella TaxID=2636909 RepID=UPI001314A9E0|nr:MULTISPECIES: acyl-CoA thioester hydrolase/BAAT C-terminal domain-containing protein [unclassified Duganella]
MKALGIVGRFFLPPGQDVSAAVLVLGGSDGGLGYASSFGRYLAAQGFAVLALAYFQKPGLPVALAELPLEYFDVATRWLENHPRIDAARIGVFGFSKGAEAALLLASRNRLIRAVVAAAPSSVVWEGLNRYRPSGRSSWSVNGLAASYVPYDRSVKHVTPLAMYTHSLDGADDLPETRIAVEKINGPVLLLSGGRDKLWPSSRMAEQIVTRLKDRAFLHVHQHIFYPDAGHPVMPLFRLRDRIMFRLMSGIFGGDAKANRSAQRDAWDRSLTFLGQHLG